MVNYSKHTNTGCPAIDMCANLIGCARENKLALKALHLTPMYYEWFKSGVQTLMNKPLEVGEMMEFDGVNIEKGTKFQSKNVILEYYEQNGLQSKN